MDWTKHKYSEPKIEVVNVTAKPKGRFPTKFGQAIGTVHHFTAGHPAVDSKKVLSMFKGLADKGLGCFGMDDNGVIYIPKGIGLFQKSYHAGSSKWLGKTGLNAWLYGIEVCSPGKVVKVGNDYYPYFNVKSGKAVKGAKPVDPARVRVWAKSPGKQHRGAYLAFNDAQVAALINWNLWQKKTNPDYSFDFCVGHDEISQSGKIDPGACMPMTMPEFRDLLKMLYAKM